MPAERGGALRATDPASAHPIVLIDGPSGAGKSTLADALLAGWPGGGPRPVLVRLDALYPGWEGLAAGSAALVDELLEPLRRIGTGSWRRWDWAADAPAERHLVTAAAPLVVEGCGALTRRAAALATARVWLDADDAVRKTRALARDGGGYDAYWDLWQRQWERHVESERPRERADLVLDVTATGRTASPSTVSAVLATVGL